MARANQFKNLSQLQKYIDTKVVPQLMNDGSLERVLKGSMQQAIYDVVYSSYVPHEYERRRDNGGLGDARLMQITNAIIINGRLSILFENLAKGNDSLSGQYLASTIQEGIKENWNNPDGVWSEPRDFIGRTVENIIANPQPLINAIKKAFVKKGFKVK